MILTWEWAFNASPLSFKASASTFIIFLYPLTPFHRPILLKPFPHPLKHLRGHLNLLCHPQCLFLAHKRLPIVS